jgi:hypothetical protein
MLALNSAIKPAANSNIEITLNTGSSNKIVQIKAQRFRIVSSRLKNGFVAAAAAAAAVCRGYVVTATQRRSATLNRHRIFFVSI